MNNILTLQQQEEMRVAFSQRNYPIDLLVANLVAAGHNETEAAQLVAAEFKAFKAETFARKVQANNEEEARKVGYGVVFMVSMIGPIFHLNSPLWYLIAFVVAGVAGYYGYKSKAVAGVAGAITLAAAFPYTYHFYFAGRHTFLSLELLIPMIMAMVPAVLVFFILSRTFYNNPETE